MSNFKFSHYISRMALNGVSVAVYYNSGQYKLVAEKNSTKIRGTLVVTLTETEYDNLPSDPYNGIKRFLAAASMCGIDFH